MNTRTFAAVSTEAFELMTKEDLLKMEILDLSDDVNWMAAFGTDEEFAQAETKLAQAKEELSAVQARANKVDEEFEVVFELNFGT